MPRHLQTRRMYLGVLGFRFVWERIEGVISSGRSRTLSVTTRARVLGELEDSLLEMHERE